MGPFLWTILNPLYKSLLCTKCGWIDPVVLIKKIFKILLMYYRNFVIVSQWKRVGTFIWKTWIFFTQGCVVPLALLLWRRRFLNFENTFSLFRVILHFNKLESPLPKYALYQIWLYLTQWFWRNKNCGKFSTTTTTDNGQIVIRKAHSKGKIDGN